MKRGRFIGVLAVGIAGWLLVSNAQATLVEYWDFTNKNHIGYNPITTESLTVAGDAQYTSAGKFGGGLLLDGNGDYLYFNPLTLAPTGIPTGNSSYTISAWMKLAPDAGSSPYYRCGIVGWGNYGTNNQVNAFRTGDGLNTLTNYWWGNDLNAVPAAPTNLRDGFWHHVAVTYDNTTGNHIIYVDGVQKGSRTAGTAPNVAATNFRIGLTYPNPNGYEYFKGVLDDVAIYNRALTPAEIQSLAAGQSPLSNVSLPQPVDHFVADSLVGLGNGAVLANGNWKSLGSNTNAQANVAGGDATLRTNTIGNHAVVNFDGDDFLRIINGAMTLSSGHARDSFTVVAVYRTNQAVTTDTNPSAQHWYEDTSIVDSEQGGVTNDWGLNINSTGQLAAGLGNPDKTQYSSSSGYYKDGLAHVAVYTRSGGTISLYVDGALVGTQTGVSTALRNAVDYFFGGNHTGGNKLIGDLAEARIYNVALDSTQVAALSSQLLTTYAPKLYHGTVLSTPGLVAYYRLGEGTTTAAKAYNEVGPDTTHGTFYNSPTVNRPGAFTIHDFNTAVEFDGTNDYITMPNFLTGSSITDFSLELLINTTAQSRTGTQAYQGDHLISADVGGAANDFVLSVLNNHLAFFDGSVNSTIQGTTAVNDGRWHHVVVTRDGGGLMQIWLDGRLEAFGTAGTAVLGAKSTITLGSDMGNIYYKGLMDEVAFYDRVLSPAEILAHYQAAAVPEPATGLLAAVGLGLLALWGIRKKGSK